MVKHYIAGYNDAKRAAAEMVLEHDEITDALRKEVEACFDIAQRMDVLAPTVSGAFTGTPSERIARQLAAMPRS